jgi:hypothetical protein
VVLEAVAIAFAAFVGMAVMALLGFAGWKYYKVLKELAWQIKVMNGSMNGVPHLMEGIKNICKDLSVNTVSLDSTVKVLKKSLIDDTSDPRRPGFLPYDTDLANAAYEAHRTAEAEAVVDLEGGRFVVD